jgi:Glycosyl transferase family 2
MQYDRSTKKDPLSDEYKSFLNSLNLNINIVETIDINHHASDCLSGWMGLKSLVCSSEDRETYEIDLRLAGNDRIFEQYLYDFGWDRSSLLSVADQQPRHKLIIYFCNPAINLTERPKHVVVPPQFLVGKYWQSIHHFYLSLPLQYPFDLPTVLPTVLPESLQLDISIDREQILLEGGLRTKGINKIGTIDRPLISIITVVFNGEEKLEQTIQSVIAQDYDNIEYIIIDGRSTDRSTEIIQKYEHRIDYWKSELDAGIYDAMNKGIDLATGQWLNFMNCGDLFYNHQSLSLIPLSADVDFYYSDTILYNSYGDTELWHCLQQQRILIHQSIVYQKNLHAAYKYLVHDKLTVSDYFFFRKNDDKHWVKLDLPLSIYNTEGSSGGGASSFVQKLFVNFMVGDISELQMSLSILSKILRAPLRIIRLKLFQLKILKSTRRF